MNVQKSCETLEELLERQRNEMVLTSEEFVALNALLLECTLKLDYVVPNEAKV